MWCAILGSATLKGGPYTFLPHGRTGVAVSRHPWTPSLRLRACRKKIQPKQNSGRKFFWPQKIRPTRFLTETFFVRFFFGRANFRLLSYQKFGWKHFQAKKFRPEEGASLYGLWPIFLFFIFHVVQSLLVSGPFLLLSLFTYDWMAYHNSCGAFATETHGTDSIWNASMLSVHFSSALRLLGALCTRHGQKCLATTLQSLCTSFGDPGLDKFWRNKRKTRK